MDTEASLSTACRGDQYITNTVRKEEEFNLQGPVASGFKRNNNATIRKILVNQGLGTKDAWDETMDEPMEKTLEGY